MSYLYYLKKCGHQELGSIEDDGKPHRGRYLLTSMNSQVLSFFPALSKTQLNDSALVPIIPLNTGKKVYCNFVYHNDKYHGSTAKHPRNEYRLYSNQALENNSLLFNEGDIVIFRIQPIDTDDPDCMKDDCYEQDVYLMMVIDDHSSTLYATLNSVIEKSAIKGGYGFYDQRIDEFEDLASSLSSSSHIDVEIDNSVTEKLVGNIPATKISDLFDAPTFRDFVMTGYGNRCAITGQVICYNSLMNLEAAHIMPKSHGGLFMPNNGLALCRDLHWAFDKGFFTITDEFKVKVHPSIHSEYLDKYNGASIRVPQNPFFVPDVNNLHYHQQNIYGLFLTSGRL